MSLIKNILKTGILAGALALALNTTASAGGSLKDEPKKACDLSANVALTTDYIFRGVSQSSENPAIQGGMDVACGIFYAGVWGSSIDFDANDSAAMELDVYAGITPSYQGLSFDLGALYYAYPGATEGLDYDYFEFKAGVSTEIKSVSIGATFYYSPDFFGGIGDALASEGSISFGLGTYAGLSPTFSALVGYQEFYDAAGDYAYWNAGVGFDVYEKFNVDLRYWDTDLEGTLSEERFVATVSASF